MLVISFAFLLLINFLQRWSSNREGGMTGAEPTALRPVTAFDG
jgi:hypothetical protein